MLTLTCDTCGKEISVDIRKRGFKIDIVKVAKEHHWWVHYMDKNPSFVFCCFDCYQLQFTKDGNFRKRLKKNNDTK